MKKLLVCDLDNTLYDWVGYFVPSFNKMIEEVVRITRIDRKTILADFKRVHQLHNDSEHPFALLETEFVKKLYPNYTRRELGVVFDSAFHAFNSERKRTLKLYDGVQEGLDKLAAKDVVLVAHTEGKLFSVLDRLRRLDILHYFSNIYCRERSAVEHVRSEVGETWLHEFPMEKITELSLHQIKPNPKILREICELQGISPMDSFYVGDSLAKDIVMAKQVGVTAIWAKYGTQHKQTDYADLVSISHWTEEDVEREAWLNSRAKGVDPDWVLEKSFTQIVQCIL